MTTTLSHTHIYHPATTPNAPTLLLLHGTGGNEHDLLDLGRTLAPTHNLLSPRGQVLEHGMPRFFRRIAEGVFDLPDLIRRAHALADFLASAATYYRFDPTRITALGFSNGANIAAALLLLRPDSLAHAALWRPMVPLTPDTPPNLAGKHILITSGQHDTMVSPQNRTALAALFETHGATVTAKLFPTGHNLTQQDLDITRTWLSALPGNL